MANKTANNKAARRPFPWFKVLLTLSVLVGGIGIFYDAQVRYGFTESQWQSPARVYARALTFYDGLFLTVDDLNYELKLLGYQRSNEWRRPGTYWHEGKQFKIATRGEQQGTKAQRFQFDIDAGKVRSLRSAWGGELTSAHLEPLMIGGIYPRHKEDRLLVRLNDVPLSLRDTLLLVEDRDFYEHWGLSPKAIGRALFANIKAGRTVQGGSTITQQLVKNVFLTRTRSWWRKASEAVMTLLTELHYSKEQILEAYINEIYLGQEGPRAIHGFALASQHYFNRPLHELDVGQIALLVGMVKGPSYYDPWRYPERAKERRNVVLALMAKQQLINQEQSDFYQTGDLSLAKASAMAGVYPAYLDLVKRQLRRDYSDRDLQTQGMQIHTAFDPLLQRHAERSLASVTKTLDSNIEGAVVVTRVKTGEVAAMVGGRKMRFAGFNRAIDAVRPVGSLIKPAIYLTALEQPQQYTLVSRVNDTVLSVKGADGSLWQPANFDHKSHGQVLLHEALAHSYNQAAARLGMEIGLKKVVTMIERLGVEREQPAVPALLLGAGAMAPIEVAQMYQTIASHGVRRPLRSILEISDSEGKLLARYPDNAQPTVAPSVIHLLHYAMMEVVREGTGRGVYQQLPEGYAVAGKTGTTNDLRDSWFAGFAGDYLAVVWMGRDDNGSANLTGSSGALKVWRELFSRSSREPINLTPPDGVTYRWIDSQSGLLSSSLCDGARLVPFIIGSGPETSANCNTSAKGVLQWFRRLFE